MVQPARASVQLQPIWRSISAHNSNHTCALTWNGGKVWCWGRNNFGQLGNSSVPTSGTLAFTNSTVPVQVLGLAGPAVAIAVGNDTSCAILNTGSVQCWGSNENYMLGTSSVSPGNGYTSSPVYVNNLGAPAIALSIGYEHACAVLNNGTVSCWGFNHQYSLGTSWNSGDYALPAAVPGVSGAIAIAAGMDSTCAIEKKSQWGGLKIVTFYEPVCWGDNGASEGGQPPSYGFLPTAYNAAPWDLTGITAGNLFGCALSASSNVICWGRDFDEGELGDNHSCHDTGSGSTNGCYMPQTVWNIPSGAKRVASGGDSSCALAGDSTIYCWGDNTYGQSGSGYSWYTPQNIGNFPSPTQAMTYTNTSTDVGVGGDYACALTDNGNRIQCWGRNNQGQLGNGTYNDSPSPTYTW